MRQLLILAAVVLAGVAHSDDDLPTLMPTAPDLDATTIMQRAHDAAGGTEWVSPQSLSLTGYAVFYRNGAATRHEQHRMWRVYASGKQDAHRADGKVRIESIRGDRAIIDLSFDGAATYTAAGRAAPSAADAQWSSSFGFGVIRHALDDDYTLQRLPDDLVDGSPTYVINVVDPAGGETRFAIAQGDYAILRVGFDTPRGWHERIYSDFFSNEGERWRQPARVRLYYDGVKANEVIWTAYAINDTLPDCLFVLPEATDCRDD
ncbi:MAG: hypothetical protein AAGF61_15010 [Pseudomonadota bacterium]